MLGLTCHLLYRPGHIASPAHSPHSSHRTSASFWMCPGLCSRCSFSLEPPSWPTLPSYLSPDIHILRQGLLHGRKHNLSVHRTPCLEGSRAGFNILLSPSRIHNNFGTRGPTFSLCSGPCRSRSQFCPQRASSGHVPLHAPSRCHGPALGAPCCNQHFYMDLSDCVMVYLPT